MTIDNKISTGSAQRARPTPSFMLNSRYRDELHAMSRITPLRRGDELHQAHHSHQQPQWLAILPGVFRRSSCILEAQRRRLLPGRRRTRVLKQRLQF